jgi:hypothetical protein
LSVELRSRALVERHPDPIERARVVRAACRRLLAEDGPERSDRPGRPA